MGPARPYRHHRPSSQGLVGQAASLVAGVTRSRLHAPLTVSTGTPSPPEAPSAAGRGERLRGSAGFDSSRLVSDLLFCRA